ncbi:hypothetical protein VNO78_25162 [Psophocarpus tetragonolobus]|uniref:Uncharacterized protein n=1 Tax=Psophocarpus tetragonolobus TaxID=3891 RepID=A0AAN9XF65_PSOTE
MALNGNTINLSLPPRGMQHEDMFTKECKEKPTSLALAHRNQFSESWSGNDNGDGRETHGGRGKKKEAKCFKEILICYPFSTKVCHNTWLGKDSDHEFHFINICLYMTKSEEKEARFVSGEKTCLSTDDL